VARIHTYMYKRFAEIAVLIGLMLPAIDCDLHRHLQGPFATTAATPLALKEASLGHRHWSKYLSICLKASQKAPNLSSFSFRVRDSCATLCWMRWKQPKMFIEERDRTQLETSRRPLAVLLVGRLGRRAEAATTAADTVGKSCQRGHHDFRCKLKTAEETETAVAQRKR
jgi:hypothetical protein